LNDIIDLERVPGTDTWTEKTGPAIKWRNVPRFALVYLSIAIPVFIVTGEWETLSRAIANMLRGFGLLE
jgi:hypothetical protein